MLRDVFLPAGVDPTGMVPVLRSPWFRIFVREEPDFLQEYRDVYPEVVSDSDDVPSEDSDDSEEDNARYLGCSSASSYSSWIESRPNI